MKKVILGFLLILALVSCNNSTFYHGGKTYGSYNEYVESSINSLKSPVVLVGIDKYKMKTEDIILYSIYIKDGNGKIKYYSNNSDISCWIGETYNLGDTIR